MKINRFTSTDPKDMAWRVEQAYVDHYIEGIIPDRDIEAYVLQLDRDGIHDINERLNKIADYIKAKAKVVE